MKKLWGILFFFVFILACEDDVYFPLGLYNYQVERLLTNGDEQGTWLISSISIDGENQEILSCSDSVRWVFDQISSDSIAAYALTFDEQCLFYDTLIFGQVTASGDDLLFTDSLTIDAASDANDRFMLVTEVTSTRLKLNYELSGSEYVTTLVMVPSSLLARQASAIFTGGIASGDKATWRAISETIDGVASTDLDTCTNAKRLIFERLASGAISLVQYQSDSLCLITQESFGEIRIDEETGFFADRISLAGDGPSEILFTSFDLSTMSISYQIEDTISVESIYSKE